MVKVIFFLSLSCQANSWPFPISFKEYAGDDHVNDLKDVLCIQKFMGICEERQRQGPGHPLMFPQKVMPS